MQKIIYRIVDLSLWDIIVLIVFSQLLVYNFKQNVGESVKETSIEFLKTSHSKNYQLLWWGNGIYSKRILDRKNH